jgi:hypothetical protein
LVRALVRRLGIAPAADAGAIAAALLAALATREASIDRMFFDWRGGRDPGAEAYPAESFRKLAALLDGRERPRTHPYWSDAEPCSMHIEEVEAIWEAIASKDDWSPFEAKIAAVRRMGEALVEDRPPSP